MGSANRPSTKVRQALRAADVLTAGGAPVFSCEISGDLSVGGDVLPPRGSSVHLQIQGGELAVVASDGQTWSVTPSDLSQKLLICLGRGREYVATVTSSHGVRFAPA